MHNYLNLWHLIDDFNAAAQSRATLSMSSLKFKLFLHISRQIYFK